MAKNTMESKLPQKLKQKIQIVGDQIKLSQPHRNSGMTQIAERGTCSPVLKMGFPLPLCKYTIPRSFEDDISLIVKDDELEHHFQDCSLVNHRHTF